jgi:hypothetical protein
VPVNCPVMPRIVRHCAKMPVRKRVDPPPSTRGGKAVFLASNHTSYVKISAEISVTKTIINIM